MDDRFAIVKREKGPSEELKIQEIFCTCLKARLAFVSKGRHAYFVNLLFQFLKHIQIQ